MMKEIYSNTSTHEYGIKEDELLERYSRYLGIRYAGNRHPDNTPVSEFREGCNCQLFLLGIWQEKFGIVIPAGWRSKEVWDDNCFTRHVDFRREYIQETDAVFYLSNKRAEVKFAHVGMVADGEEVNNLFIIHNSKAVNYSTIWPSSRFLENGDQTLIGIKRPIR